MTECRLLLVAPDLAGNSLGRAYCLWLLGTAAGWPVDVVSVQPPVPLWPPLARSPFAAACAAVPPGELVDRASAADVVVAVKPVEESLGRALRARARVGFPLWVDVDDPDLEVRHFAKPWRDRLSLGLRTPGYWARLHALRGLARTLPSTVSNPVLRAGYGGLLLPHVRPVAPPRRHRAGDGLSVAFVGTPRPHKGLDDLRRVVAGLPGVTLVVSAPPPPDARPAERWIGATTLDGGAQLLRRADVVVVPTRAEGWGSGQLPAKLVDAMMAGAAVVATDVGPSRWALGDGGLLVPPGDDAALAAALRRCGDAAFRAALGARAHARAARLFSVDALLPAFTAFAERVRRGSPRRPVRPPLPLLLGGGHA